MSTYYKLVSNIPLTKLLGEILPRTAFRTATGDECAERQQTLDQKHRYTPSPSSDHDPFTQKELQAEDDHLDERTATVMAAVLEKRAEPGQWGDPNVLLMTSPAGVAWRENHLNTDWLWVNGDDEGVRIDVDNLHRWTDEQRDMIRGLADAIAGVDIWSTSGVSTSLSIGDMRRLRKSRLGRRGIWHRRAGPINKSSSGGARQCGRAIPWSPRMRCF